MIGIGWIAIILEDGTIDIYVSEVIHYASRHIAYAGCALKIDLAIVSNTAIICYNSTTISHHSNSAVVGNTTIICYNGTISSKSSTNLIDKGTTVYCNNPVGIYVDGTVIIDLSRRANVYDASSSVRDYNTTVVNQ